MDDSRTFTFANLIPCQYTVLESSFGLRLEFVERPSVAKSDQLRTLKFSQDFCFIGKDLVALQ